MIDELYKDKMDRLWDRLRSEVADVHLNGHAEQRLPGNLNISFEGVDAGIRSLRAGRIDYFIHDAPTVWRLAGDPTSRDLQGLYHPLTEEHLAWAVKPGNAKLLALLDATLAHLKREGLIEPIVDRWIPVRVTIR